MSFFCNNRVNVSGKKKKSKMRLSGVSSYFWRIRERNFKSHARVIVFLALGSIKRSLFVLI